ncbi:MAG TPA: phosphoserine phosphatase SerB [Rhodospirillaceae bacterium]|nr:phosphoserine phosphatase SerB [Rhodospirillaceae bacterium]
MTSHVVVFVAGRKDFPLSADFIASLHPLFRPDKLRWLHQDKAADIEIDADLSPDLFHAITEIAGRAYHDVFMLPASHRRKKLLLADMDATIVAGETLDDLAAFAGLQDKIAAITARAMRGELDFQEALEQRVKMLDGLSISALEQTLSAMTINAGAIETIRVMRAHGAECYLVSGGFTYFTEAIARKCGFHGHHGNRLDIRDGVLTGHVLPPILDKNAKLALLRDYTARCGISRQETMAVGDGANDIPMLSEAGTGVGYHPKPLVKEQIANAIIHTDLTSLLYIQGYTWQDIGPT